MESAAPASAAASRPDDWRLLSALGLYRLLLVALLLTLLQSGYAGQFFERVRPGLFLGACLGYALGAIALQVLVMYRTPRIAIQAHVHFAVDLAAVTVLVYASSGVPNGLGMLLLTPAVGCSLVLTPRMAMVQAAAATLAMFGEETFRQLRYYTLDPSDFTQTGILGLMFFATNLAANAVAQRARKSEALAERVGVDLANLSRLNESIVESMQTGVIVIDAQRRVRTVNAAARRLLGVRGTLVDRPLAAALPQLGTAVEDWLEGRAPDGRPFAERPGGHELLPRFTRLGWGPEAPILVLVDDAAVLREQAQQMKLAALGRLSASIAHEIRNPLSAIAHAGQLLAESSEIRAEDQRLLGMIQRHAGRIDKIVRDVLELSRRDAAQRTRVGLRGWLLRTCAVYQEAHASAPRPIELLDIPPDLHVRCDPSHLQQVLFNLWDNSFEHGTRDGASLVVLVSAGRLDDTGQPYLDVSDNGGGIAPDLLDKIFEPFFTTSSNGTGLGLYLSRELCEYNQARLSYLPQPRGACFRIVFLQDSR